MGLGHCQKCDSLTGVALACPHVAAAASSAAPRFDAELRRYVDTDGAESIYPVTFCRACIERLGLPPDGAHVSREFLEVVEVEGVCGGCLQRWFNAPAAERVAAPDRRGM